MDAYYHNQATMPHFSGHYRQRGSGFGALPMGIGRVALPLARKFIIPAAKRIGKELLVQVGSGKKSAHKIKKRKTSVKRLGKKTSGTISKKRTLPRSRSNFFTRRRNGF